MSRIRRPKSNKAREVLHARLKIKQYVMAALTAYLAITVLCRSVEAMPLSLCQHARQQRKSMDRDGMRRTTMTSTTGYFAGTGLLLALSTVPVADLREKPLYLMSCSHSRPDPVGAT